MRARPNPDRTLRSLRGPIWAMGDYTTSKQVGSVVEPDPDPHHFGNLDPHPHQIQIRIRIKIYKLDPEPDPHQFADVKPKCIEFLIINFAKL
jgi:hypothetical protein